jgi:hypothetical protein
MLEGVEGHKSHLPCKYPLRNEKWLAKFAPPFLKVCFVKMS